MGLFKRRKLTDSEGRVVDALIAQRNQDVNKFDSEHSPEFLEALNILETRRGDSLDKLQSISPSVLEDMSPPERMDLIEKERELTRGGTPREEFEKLGYTQLKEEKKKKKFKFPQIFKKKEPAPDATVKFTFDDAFARAREQGLEEFEYDGKMFTTEVKEEVDRQEAPVETSPLTDVDNIINDKKEEEIIKQREQEEEESKKIVSDFALNIADNDILNSSEYYKTFKNRQYLKYKDGIDIEESPDKVLRFWKNTLIIRGDVGEKIGDDSPYMYWKNQGVLDASLDWEDQTNLFVKAIESGKLNEELGIGEEKKEEIEYKHPDTGADFADTLVLGSTLDRMKPRSKDSKENPELLESYNKIMGVVGQQRETARTFFSLLKAYQKDSSLTNKLALNKFYENLVPVAEERGKKTRDWKDAVIHYAENPSKLVPFYGSYVEAKELGRAVLILTAYDQFGKEPSEEDMEFLNYISEKDFTDDPSTTGAKIVDVFANMGAFAGEIYGLNRFVALTSAATKAGSKKIVGKEIRDMVKGFLSAKYVKPVVETAKITTKSGILTKGGYRVEESKNKTLLHNYKITDDEILVGEDKISEEDAERWAQAETFIEFSSEFLGPALRFLGKGTVTNFKKIYKALPAGEKDLVLGQSLASTFKKYIETANPGIKVSDEALNKIRKALQMAGYDGFLEEFSEERAGEAMRAFLYQLSESGIIDGYDNPEFAENVVTLLADGDYAAFGEQMLIETVTLGTPGAVGTGLAVVSQKRRDAKFDKDFKDLSEKRKETLKKESEQKKELEESIDKIEEGGKEELDTETSERYEELSEKDRSQEEETEYLTIKQEIRLTGYSKLSKKEQKRHTEMRTTVEDVLTLNTLKDLLVEDPSLKGVDFSEVDLEEEILTTAEDLKEEGVGVEGEGMDVNEKIYRVRGYTVLANAKLKLGLKKGANYDTVLEEYYGIVRRGGLSENQQDIYDKHYEKYKSDAAYRKDINKFINDMAAKMGHKQEVSDENQTLSYDKLFDKEGKSYEYKSDMETKNHQADPVFKFVKNIFNRAFGRTDKSVQDVYKKVRGRKLKTSSARAVTAKARRDAKRQERREEVKTKAKKKKKHREKKRKEVKAKKAAPKKVKAKAPKEEKPLGKESKPYKIISDKKKKPKKDDISYQLTPTQKEWNKNSVVKKVVYHGTDVEFEEFEDGAWFAEDPKFAKDWAMKNEGMEGSKPQTYAAYLNITNPIKIENAESDLTAKTDLDIWFDRFSKLDGVSDVDLEILPEALNSAMENRWGGNWQADMGADLLEMDVLDAIINADNFIPWLEGLGYDGFDSYETGQRTWYAFKPNQIKSATAMAEQPTKDPRISYQLEPTKPTLYSPALRSIENLQANSLKRQGLLNHFKNAQVPKAETDWLGIDEWARENYKPNESIPKEHIIEFIKQNESEVIDVTLDTSTEDVASMVEQGLITEEDSRVTPMEHKFEKFTMVGGKDYTELLVRHPDGTYIKPSHWDIPGIIVSLRLTTRFDTEGSKTLFIEEIQSDWTSEAHKLRQKEVNKLINKGMSKSEAEKKVPEDFGFKEVGDTPYKDGWIKLGVKKAILHAVNNNFDKIAVPTWQQIADMFDVSKKISEIRYLPIDPNAKRSDAGYGRFQVAILNNNRAEISGIPRYNTPKQLEDVVGKGIVDRMMAGEGKPDPMVSGQMVLSGLDLRTPAKFHKLVYNGLADALAKQGKRLGGKPGTTDIVIEPNAMMAELDTRNPIIPQDLKDKQEYEEVLTSKASVDNFVKEGKGIPVSRKSLTLTDSLKDKVRRSGVPSFQLEPVGEPLDIYDKITGKEKFGKSSKKEEMNRYNTTIIPVSTLLKRIDPRLYIHLLKHQFEVVKRVGIVSKFVVDFGDFIKNMSLKDRNTFKLAMLNSDAATIKQLVEQYDNKNLDFMTAYKNVRDSLDQIRDGLIAVGESVGIIDDYFPRKVTDYDGLLKHLYKKDAKIQALIEKQLSAAEKKKGKPLSPSEKSDIIGLIIRGHSFSGAKPSYLKGRKIDKITPDMITFYEDPITQLLNHVEKAIDRIETRKFFGISNKDTQDMSQGEKREYYNTAVGNFVQDLMDQGLELTTKQQKEYIRIVGAYFSFIPSSENYGAVKTLTYGILLGNLTNTVTQLQDIVYAIYENKWNQIRTIKNIAIYLASKIRGVDLARIKRSSIGVDIPGIEYKMESKAGFVRFANGVTNFIFKYGGFKLADGLGKSVVINSAVQKYKSKAQKNRLSKKDKDYLKLLFGDTYDQAIEDLKAKTSPNEYTDKELFIAYATILKYQPVGKTEVPLKYLESGDVGRTLYMLRTFALKQLNVLRDKKDIVSGKQKGNKKRAAAELFYLMSLMVIAGAGGDELRNWIQGKDEDFWSEEVVDNVLKLFLLNKYMADKIQRESAYKGVFGALFENIGSSIISFPPAELGLFFIRGIEDWVSDDIKKSRVPSKIPFMGRILYTNRQLSEDVGIGGRGRDDYVKWELIDLFNKSEDITRKDIKMGRGLSQSKLDLYTEYLLDALNYPQIRIVKGEERRVINTDKHIDELARYKIRVKKNSRTKKWELRK